MGHAGSLSRTTSGVLSASSICQAPCTCSEPIRPIRPMHWSECVRWNDEDEFMTPVSAVAGESTRRSAPDIEIDIEPMSSKASCVVHGFEPVSASKTAQPFVSLFMGDSTFDGSDADASTRPASECGDYEYEIDDETAVPSDVFFSLLDAAEACDMGGQHELQFVRARTAATCTSSGPLPVTQKLSLRESDRNRED